MYGTFTDREFATMISVPSCILYGVICVTVGEWIWRHFCEGEDCLFYAIFQKKN
jgi:hypothetical protein